MRTECKQARFEFHGLFQRKVKARFDGGKITSDAGVLLLREVERGTGLIAGLAECFRDHRDPRLIEHTVEELLGQRIYGLCLGYEDLNDHDQLRTDPMLAVAVNKADPLGERRRQASDRGKALAGRCTLNRLELTGAEVDEQERYKKIAMDPDRIDGWMVDAFVESHESAPEEMVLDLDATDDELLSIGVKNIRRLSLRDLVDRDSIDIFGALVDVFHQLRCLQPAESLLRHQQHLPDHRLGVHFLESLGRVRSAEERQTVTPLDWWFADAATASLDSCKRSPSGRQSCRLAQPPESALAAGTSAEKPS